ncbi:MAG: MotE family protein [Oligoflexales bacterium]
MFLRNIFILKISILCVVSAFWVFDLEFGEKNLVGADEEGISEEQESLDEETAEIIEENIEEAATDDEDLLGFQMNEDGLKIAKANTTKKDERKGFFHGLLELPNFNSEKAKREDAARYVKIVERLQGQVRDRLELLKDKYKQLQNLEVSIDEKLQKIDDEMDFFQSTLQKEKKLQEDRLENLIAFYVKMEPKKAAPIFEKMDKDLRVALFKNMKQKQVTAILENMAPEKSVEASEYYGRIYSGREYDFAKAMNLNKSLQDEFQETCRDK